MLTASVFLATLVVGGLVIQVIQSRNLLNLFREYRLPLLSDDRLPKCAVVLCLRGCDPGLEKNIQSLIDQDYPDFHLWFVVDHPAESALDIVRKAIEHRNCTNATIRIIEPSPCASLIANHHGELLPELANEYPFIALVDADAVTWPAWLRTLVAPLVDSDLSLVYGNRWYMPRVAKFAAICRFIWNYGSVQQMVFFRYPWGGSLAMKAELALLPQFGNTLRRSFGNDTLLFSLAESAGMKMAFNPGIMMINREQICFRDFFNWIGRQMVYGKLYHPSWPLVFGTGVATALVIGSSMVLNVVSIFLMNWSALVISGSALLVFWITWTGLLFQFDNLVGRMVSVRGEPRRWWSPATAIRIFLIAPCVQFVFLAGLIRAARMRKVRWRGIDYQIDGPFGVRMSNYHPWVARAKGDESIH